MFDAARVFKAEGAFELSRISKIITAGGDLVQVLAPLIVHEDNHLLVIFKPPGWLSQSDETGDFSVNEIFGHYLKQKYAKPGNVFCAAVQRLDRPASGLMVLARTSKAAARLSEEIRERRFEKRYHVLTEASLPGGERTVLVADMQKIDRLAKKVDPPRKKQAGETNATQYALSSRLIHRDASACQYEVSIETGKFHQIRALFAAHGAPLWGDVKYGGSRLPRHKDRIALVATQLKFMHPTQKTPQVFYLTQSSLAALKTYFI